MSPEETMKKREFLFRMQKLKILLIFFENNNTLQPCHKCISVKRFRKALNCTLKTFTVLKVKSSVEGRNDDFFFLFLMLSDLFISIQ